MAIIIERHEPPPTPTPWYLDVDLDCGCCCSLFRLEASDVAGDGRDPALWTVVTERSPAGMSRVKGPCPVCGQRLAFFRLHAVKQ